MTSPPRHPVTAASESTPLPRSTDFRITVHERERILEVSYPSHPTDASYTRYAEEVREAILRLGSPWDCLVDQRALKVAPPRISEEIGALNGWAKHHGMRRTARIVANSAVAELQARRIAREAQLAESSQLFHTREEAWAYLASAPATR